MTIPEVAISITDTLSLEKFSEMDYYAVKEYQLPIELMMENAGLNLAQLALQTLEDKKAKILIGIGNGNNGGGGLVAARRLAAWGYDVYLDIFTPIDKTLPMVQLERALKFGVKRESLDDPDLWIDAYLGFSQRLPLPESLIKRLNIANVIGCKKVSLDIPTGFLGDVDKPYFEADLVMSLAAGKSILWELPESTDLYVADLGMPAGVYDRFDIAPPPFQRGAILELKRNG